jgi:hypothetical protein
LKELFQTNQRHEDTIQQLKDETAEKIKKLEINSVLYTHLSSLPTLKRHKCYKDLLKFNKINSIKERINKATSILELKRFVVANFDPTNSLQKCSKEPGKEERDSYCNWNDACNHLTSTTKRGREGCGCVDNVSHLACFLRDYKTSNWGWSCMYDSCQGEKTREDSKGKMRYEFTLKDFQNYFTRSLDEPGLLKVWRDQLV